MASIDDEKPKKIAQRLTNRLAKDGWSVFPSALLRNQGELVSRTTGKKVFINATAMVVIMNILDHKWDSKAPWPAVTTIAKRMQVTSRTVRSALERLEKDGFVVRQSRAEGRTNAYILKGLFEAIEETLDPEPDDKKAAAVAPVETSEASSPEAA